MKRSRIPGLALLVLMGGPMLAPIHAEDKTLPKQRKKMKLHAVRIAFKHSGMSAPRTIPLANKNPGVVTGDSLEFSAVLDPALTLDNTRYSWSGAASGQGPLITPAFGVPGNRALTLSVLDKGANRPKTFTATTRVRSVGIEKEPDICPTAEPGNCLKAAQDANLAESWAESGDMAEALGFPRGPCTADDGRCNSAKHAYWNLLMVRDTDPAFAARLATAHERYSSGYIFTSPSGLEAGSAHNSIAMDLDNNSSGRTIASGMTFASGLPFGDGPGKAAVASAVNTGGLTKLDTSSNLANTNPEGSGLLEPTNQ